MDGGGAGRGAVSPAVLLDGLDTSAADGPDPFAGVLDGGPAGPLSSFLGGPAPRQVGPSAPPSTDSMFFGGGARPRHRLRDAVFSTRRRYGTRPCRRPRRSNLPAQLFFQRSARPGLLGWG